MAVNQPTNEKWLPVVGYEGTYEVSDHGNVRSVTRIVRGRGSVMRRVQGRPLQPLLTGSGHETINGSVDGKRKRLYVHRLVLEAFVGACPDGMEGCHNDGNPQNNHVDNLRWDTRGNNCLDTVQHGRNPMSLRKQCPRGHGLIEPNLRADRLARGHRTCLACDRARAYARKYGIMDRFEEIADQRYAEIMSD